MFLVNRKYLTSILTAVKSLELKKSSSYTILLVKDDCLVILATDLTATYVHKIKAFSQYDYDKESKFFVDITFLTKVIKSTKDELVEINLNDGKLMIDSVLVPLKDCALNLDSLFEGDTLTTINFDKSTIKKIALTAKAASKDTSKQALTAVNMRIDEGKLHIAATDGHRLNYCTQFYYGQSLESINTPARYLTSLSKVFTGSGHIINYGNNVEFCEDDTSLVIRKVEDEYPNYNQLIEYNPTKFTVIIDKKDCLYFTNLYTGKDKDDNYICIDVENCEPSIINRVSNTNQAGDVVTNCQSPYRFNFNLDFFKSALENINSNKIKFTYSNNNSPVILMDLENSDDIFLVMPIKLRLN